MISSSRLLILFLSIFLINCGGGGGSGSGEQPVPVNQKPVANAGADQAIDEKLEITLTGSGTDSDGSIQSYRWEQISGDAIEISGGLNQANLTFTAPVAKTAMDLGFRLTVTDNSGATDSDLVSVTVEPVYELTFHIDGQVTNGDLEKATIKLTAGDYSVETVSGTSGTFILPVEADEDFAGKVVMLSAKGSGEQDFIEFRSIRGDLITMFQDSGEDKRLNIGESLSTNMSYMSTAIAAMLIRANDGVLPQDKATLNNLVPKLSGMEVERASVALAFLVEHSAEFAELALPAGMTNSWQLLNSEADLAVYVSLINSSSHSANYEKFRGQIFSNFTISKGINDIPAFYTWLEGNADLYTDHLSFAADGTGSYASGQYGQTFDWTKTQDLLVIDLESKLASSELVSRSVNGFERTVLQEIYHETIVISSLISSEDADLVKYSVRARFDYPNGELIGHVAQIESIRLMAKTHPALTGSDLIGTKMLPVNASKLNPFINGTHSLGNYTTAVTNRAVSFNFQANGQVTTSSDILGNGSWTIDEFGVAQLVLADNQKLAITKLKENVFSVSIKEANNDQIGFIAGMSALRQEKNLWDEQDVAGIYVFEQLITHDLYQFWLELNEDKTAKQIHIRDRNHDGKISSEEYIVEPAIWYIKDGELVVERYRGLGGLRCEVITEDCYIYNRRTLDLFAIEGNQYFTINRHQFNFEPLIHGMVNDDLRARWTWDIFTSRYWVKTDQRPLEQPEVEGQTVKTTGEKAPINID